MFSPFLGMFGFVLGHHIGSLGAFPLPWATGGHFFLYRTGYNGCFHLLGLATTLPAEVRTGVTLPTGFVFPEDVTTELAHFVYRVLEQSERLIPQDFDLFVGGGFPVRNGQ